MCNDEPHRGSECLLGGRVPSSLEACRDARPGVAHHLMHRTRAQVKRVMARTAPTARRLPRQPTRALEPVPALTDVAPSHRETAALHHSTSLLDSTPAERGDTAAGTSERNGGSAGGRGGRSPGTTTAPCAMAASRYSDSSCCNVSTARCTPADWSPQPPRARGPQTRARVLSGARRRRNPVPLLSVGFWG
jgi:hypothetical protein